MSRDKSKVVNLQDRQAKRRKSPEKADEDLKRALAEARGDDPAPVYQATDHGLAREKMTQDGPVLVYLANFVARIVAEEERDDGEERTLSFVVEGKLGEQPLPAATVTAEEFAGMGWVAEHWGARAIVWAGAGAKDHLRAAIQSLSHQITRRTVYEHTGWRQIGGKWVYLHAGGAIGADGQVTGVSVECGQDLRDLELPDPPEDEELRRAVRASLAVLAVAPDRITVPLLAATYRAPLGEILPVDHSVHLTGKTGAKKSSISALAQAHYGARWDTEHLPGSWESTGNALERLAFEAKDAILTVDDFAPGGSQYDVAKLHKQADRLLRAQANRRGRQRMRADSSLRRTYWPRGLVLSSGEDVPRGQSLRARMMVVEVGPEDVDLDRLTEAQELARAGELARAMAGYLCWLAPQVDELRQGLPGRKAELRAHARQEQWDHDRTPDLLASMAVGWEMFLLYAEAVEAITPEEGTALWDRGWSALVETARGQAGLQAAEDPAGRFVELLGAALASGQAHLADTRAGGPPPDAEQWGWERRTVGTGMYAQTEWQARGRLVGWLADGEIRLEPDAAYAEAQRLARDQGTSLPITQQALWRRMAEKGLLIPAPDGQHLAPQRRVVGRRRRVVILPAQILENVYGDSGDTGDTPDQERVSARKTVSSPNGEVETGPPAVETEPAEVETRLHLPEATGDKKQGLNAHQERPVSTVSSNSKHNSPSPQLPLGSPDRPGELNEAARRIIEAPPDRPCAFCGGRDFWREPEPGRPWRCRRCYEPHRDDVETYILPGGDDR